jgi:hypothetical protein
MLASFFIVEKSISGVLDPCQTHTVVVYSSTPSGVVLYTSMTWQAVPLVLTIRGVADTTPWCVHY